MILTKNIPFFVQKSSQFTCTSFSFKIQFICPIKRSCLYLLRSNQGSISQVSFLFLKGRQKWAKRQHYCMLRDFRSVCFKAIQGGQSFMHQSNFLCKIPWCSFFTYCRVSQFYTSSIPQQKTLLIEQKVEVEANASYNS